MDIVSNKSSALGQTGSFNKRDCIVHSYAGMGVLNFVQHLILIMILSVTADQH